MKAIALVLLASCSIAGTLSVVGPKNAEVGVFANGETPEAVFTLANSGKDGLKILRAVSTCRCLRVVQSPKSLAPGEKGQVRVAVDPYDATTPFEATVLVETDSQKTPFSHLTIRSKTQWNFAKLFKTPKVWDAPQFNTNGVKAIFYEGEPFGGKETRVFAYIGLPEAAKTGKKVPGMVLVHGGGGSAFQRWVRFWNSKGYAAISMDTCGKISGNTIGDEQRKHYPHEHSGPAGWGAFDKATQPPQEQWMHHAVAAVIRGNSLLRSLSEVNAEKIGITGVSWGGVITCIAAPLDRRFAFAMPVYGCGFLGESSVWKDNHFDGISQELGERWVELWDPSHFLPLAAMPFLWLDGTNDFAFPLDSLRKSRAVMNVPQWNSTVVRLVHTHGKPSEEAEILWRFADSQTKGAPALPQFRTQKQRGNKVAATFVADGMVPQEATLQWTADGGVWNKRAWSSQKVEMKNGEVAAELPQGTTAFYFSLKLPGGAIVSTETADVEK